MSVVEIKERVKKWREKQRQAGGKSVTIMLNPVAVTDLEEIKKMTNFSTIADVINQSLTAYKILLDKEADGYEVFAILDKGNSEEVIVEKIKLY